MFSLWLLCGVLCIWTFKIIFINGQKTTNHKLPPIYPGALPLIGHAYLLLGDTERLWQQVRKFAEETVRVGGICAGFVGNTVYYVITDPNDALTASNACLQKHFAYNFAKAWLGSGLITGSGETWKRHRKLLIPAFSRSVTLSFLEVFNDQSKLLLKDFDLHIGRGAFNQSPYLRSRALETFCLTAFGINTVESNFVAKYMKAVDQILFLVTTRFQTFYLHNDLIYKLCGYKKKEDEAIRILNSMSNEVIQMKRNSMKNGRITDNERKYKPFLDLLMELSDENTLTDAEIREEVDTAIVAGFDTTSNSIGYMLAFLGHYPEVQEKVYKEYMEVVGPDRDIEKDDLKSLVYTTAVIKETLRIYPTGAGLLRHVDKDVKLKNYTMRAGSNCVLIPYGSHRHEVWGEDRELFKPERWLDADNLPDEAVSFGGFSWGKRNCIGKTYAIISMQVTMGHLIRRYKVKSDITNLRLRLDFMLKPFSGHEIILERRI